MLKFKGRRTQNRFKKIENNISDKNKKYSLK